VSFSDILEKMDELMSYMVAFREDVDGRLSKLEMRLQATEEMSSTVTVPGPSPREMRELFLTQPHLPTLCFKSAVL
jgi:hypothetical protein